MTSPTAGNPAEPVAAIIRFTLREGVDDAAFVTNFTGQADVLRQRPGYLGNSLLRSARTPGSYVNLGWWADRRSYLDVVSSPEFRAHVGALSELAVPQPDQAVGTGFGTAAGPEFAHGGHVTAITWFTLRDSGDPAAFRAAFDEHALFMRAREGFLGHRLLRSAVRQDVFVNVGWWRSPAEFLATMKTPEFAADAQRMAALVQAGGDLFTPTQVLTG